MTNNCILKHIIPSRGLHPIINYVIILIASITLIRTISPDPLEFELKDSTVSYNIN